MKRKKTPPEWHSYLAAAFPKRTLGEIDEAVREMGETTVKKPRRRRAIAPTDIVVEETREAFPFFERPVRPVVFGAPEYDKVNPPHYKGGLIEHCEYVEAQGPEWATGYFAGQITRYIHRAGKKPDAEMAVDLSKARWYLERWIAFLERGPAIRGRLKDSQ